MFVWLQEAAETATFAAGCFWGVELSFQVGLFLLSVFPIITVRFHIQYRYQFLRLLPARIPLFCVRSWIPHVFIFEDHLAWIRNTASKRKKRVSERKKSLGDISNLISIVPYIELIIATVPYFSVGFPCMPCREKETGLKWNELPNTVKLSLLSKKTSFSGTAQWIPVRWMPQELFSTSLFGWCQL